MILDALSYESYRDVLPLYYGQTISQKGLRDEDWIEMLSIINETRVSESGLIFGVTSGLVNALKSLDKGRKGRLRVGGRKERGERRDREADEALLESIE